MEKELNMPSKKEKKRAAQAARAAQEEQQRKINEFKNKAESLYKKIQGEMDANSEDTPTTIFEKLVNILHTYPSISKLISVLKEKSPETVAGELSNRLQNENATPEDLLTYESLKEYVLGQTRQEAEQIKIQAQQEAAQITTQAQQEVATKEQEKGAIQVEIDTLNGQKTQLNTDVSTLTTQKEGLETTNANLQTRNEQLQQEIKAAEPKKQELEQREQSVKEKEADVNRRLDANTTAAKSIQVFRQLITKDMNLAARAERNERLAERYRSKCQDLTQQVQDLNQERRLYTNADRVIEAYQVQDKERLLASTLEKVEHLESEIETQKDTLITQKNAEVSTLKQAYQDLKNLNDNLQVQLQHLRATQQINQEQEEKISLLEQKANYFKQINDQMKAWMEKGNQAECPALSALDITMPAKVDIHNATIGRQPQHINSLKALADYLYAFCVNPPKKDFDNNELNLEPLYYKRDDICAFIAGLGIGKLTILQGTSGVGKSSLPKRIGRALYLPEYTKDTYPNVIAVGSSWRERDEMFGYYNDFSKKFKAKEFTCAVYKANFYPDRPYFIVLDEMNLSRVEYYFADILSGIDTEKGISVRLLDSEEMQENWPKYLKNGELTIPENVYFIGTANIDSSTMDITDKVYDRANVLSFHEIAPEPDNKPETPKFQTISFSGLQNMFSKINSLDKLPEIYVETKKTLEKLDIFVGYRMEKQLKKFIRIFEACGGEAKNAEDIFIVNKILRKLEGKEGKEDAKKSFRDLEGRYDADNYERCKKFLKKWNDEQFPKEDNN